MTIKTATRKDLRGKHLIRVHGRQPNANNVETWEEEAAEIASAINVKSRFIQGGEIHGLLAMVIPEDEYRLEIEDMDFEYCTIRISREERMNMHEKYWKQNTVTLRMTTNAISVLVII